MYVYIYTYIYIYIYVHDMYVFVSYFGNLGNYFSGRIFQQPWSAFSRRNVDVNVACWKKRFDPRFRNPKAFPTVWIYETRTVNNGINYQMVQDFWKTLWLGGGKGWSFVLKRCSFRKGISESKLISLWSTFFPGSPKIQFDKRENPETIDIWHKHFMKILKPYRRELSAGISRKQSQIECDRYHQWNL